MMASLVLHGHQILLTSCRESVHKRLSGFRGLHLGAGFVRPSESTVFGISVSSTASLTATGLVIPPTPANGATRRLSHGVNWHFVPRESASRLVSHSPGVFEQFSVIQAGEPMTVNEMRLVIVHVHRPFLFVVYLPTSFAR